MQKAIQALRQLGAQVRVHHYRKVMDTSGGIQNLPRHEALKHYTVLPNGGSTLVEVDHPTGRSYSVRARCSDCDNFQYSTGVTVALGRVLNLMEFDETPKIRFTYKGVDYLVDSAAVAGNSFIKFRGTSPTCMQTRPPERLSTFTSVGSEPPDSSCYTSYPVAEFTARVGTNIDYATWTPKSGIEVSAIPQPA